MAIDFIGINNVNEYYTNHYLNTIFEENVSETTSSWREDAKKEELRTPWSLLRECARQYYTMHEKGLRSRSSHMFPLIKDMAVSYLEALGYEKSESFKIPIDDDYAYIYSEIKKQNGAPLLWIMLSNKNSDEDSALLYELGFDGDTAENNEPNKSIHNNEDMAAKLFYSLPESPRWIIIIGEKAIALLDRKKWNEKRYLEFDLEEIFSRREDSTLQVMSVLLHKDSLCPDEGSPLLDTLDENSHKHASGVSQDLKYALRESIELLGNEVLYDMTDEEYRGILDSKRDKIKEDLLECFNTKRKNLFVTDTCAVVMNIKERYHIPRLHAHLGRSSSDIEWGYVGDVLQELIDAGAFETADTKHGTGFRTKKIA